MGDKVIRTYLNFNSYDFRRRKVMEILSSKPRNKTELVVNAVLHYISCPEAADEVIQEMLADGSLSGLAAPPAAHEQTPENADDLSDMMAAFRGG